MYIYFYDSDYGYLKVSLKELGYLGIQNSISKFSYMDTEFVYLEKEVDMHRFLAAKNNPNITVEFRQTDMNEFFQDLTGYR